MPIEVDMILASAKDIERYTAQGVWGKVRLDVMLQRRAGACPDRLALQDPPNRAAFATGPTRALTYRQSWKAVRELAAALKALGLAPGDIVGIQLPPIVEAPLTLLACWHAGLIASPLPVAWRAGEITRALDSVGARALIAWSEPNTRQRLDDLCRAGAGIASIRAVLAFGEHNADGVIRLGDIFAAAVEEPAANAPTGENENAGAGSQDESGAESGSEVDGPNAAATVTWDISSTPDADTAAVRSHNEWIAAGIATVLGAGLREHPTILCPYPLNNLVSIGALMVPWLMNAGTLVLHRPFDLEIMCAQLARMPAQFTCLPPAMARQLTNEIVSRDLSGALDVLAVHWKNENPVPLDGDTGTPRRIDIINLAEIALVLGNREADQNNAPGLPLDDASNGATPVTCQIRLGQTRDGDSGHRVEVRSPMAPGARLTGQREAGSGVFSASGDAQGFVATGLHARRLPGGGFCLAERRERPVLHGAMALSLGELDDLYKSHRGVADAAALTAPDDIMGQRLIAAIVPAGDEGDEGEPRRRARITLPDFTAHLRALGVAAYKHPDHLVVVDEIPRDAHGNIARDRQPMINESDS